MGTLLDRNRGILARARDLSPLAETVRAILTEGNAAAILAGQTPEGATVAPLAASTLRHRSGTGPPRAPLGRASQVIAGLVVVVDIRDGELTARKTWPGFADQVAGMDRKRPTVGTRPQDLEQLRAKLRDHLMK